MNVHSASALALALIVAAACTGAANSPSASASARATATSPVPAPPTSSSAPASPAASRSPIPLPTAAQVAAAGSGVVWMLVADRLFVSTDTGATWSERSMPSPSVDGTISFVSDSQGWMLGAGSPATQCTSQSVTLWRTNDGARTWQNLAATGFADTQCKGPIAFVDAQRGYVSAWSQNERPVIYRTGDGGKTWSASTPLPDPSGFAMRGAGVTLRAGPVSDFGTSQLLYATDTQQRGFAFRSTDGGATWKPTETLTPPMGVVIITATRWIQISSPGDSKETTDGGGSWHAFVTDYQQAAPIAPQIAFGDASTGYATVRGGLQRTTDGGAHWTMLRTPGT